MKNCFKIICLIIICLFINIIEIQAKEKYLYYGRLHTDSNGYLKTPGAGNHFGHSEAYIEINKKGNKYNGTAYDESKNKEGNFIESNKLGAEEDLIWTEQNYPKFIIVYNPAVYFLPTSDVQWYGEDDEKCIEKFSENKEMCFDGKLSKASWTDELYIFILESYFDSYYMPYEKVCKYLNGGFLLLLENGEVEKRVSDSYKLSISQTVLDKVLNSDNCPNISYCMVEDNIPNESGNMPPTELHVFLDDIEAKAAQENGVCPDFNGVYVTDGPLYNTSDKDKVDYCDTYDTLLKEYEENYKSCKTSFTKCNESTSNENRIKSLCNSVMQTQNFRTSICLRACLNLQEDIFDIKGITLISGKCTVSDKLIVFIRNILRWVKYIIPVSVIILGILDFIKAIGGDKEDEMKKAQQRFIRRLIAAALIFLVPLIIEFVLGKMGFGYNDCGLFD